MSNVLPAADGKTFVDLTVPDNGYTGYIWKSDSSDSVLSTEKIFRATQPGNYKVVVTEKYGCSSVYSPLYKVVNASGNGAPEQVRDVSATASSYTQATITWSDNPHPVNNETAFEIYRATTGGGPYTFLGTAMADSILYKDNNLSAGTKYFYIVRAINNNGAASISNEASCTTDADKIPPTPPNNLRIDYTTNNAIALKWDSATDNIGVAGYDIYLNGSKNILLQKLHLY